MWLGTWMLGRGCCMEGGERYREIQRERDRGRVGERDCFGRE